jgi:P2-related tail formation protein
MNNKRPYSTLVFKALIDVATHGHKCKGTVKATQIILKVLSFNCTAIE